LSGWSDEREKGDTMSVSAGGAIEVSDVNGLGAALEAKQPVTDNTLTTTAKTVSGAINELAAQLSGVQAALEAI